MKRLSITIAFFSGFAVAGVLGAILIHMEDKTRRMNIASDVDWPLSLIIEDIQKTAAEGKCEKAAVQLALLKKRFDEYRSGGPTPADWREEVVAEKP